VFPSATQIIEYINHARLETSGHLAAKTCSKLIPDEINGVKKYWSLSGSGHNDLFCFKPNLLILSAQIKADNQQGNEETSYIKLFLHQCI